jgi:hypothetical protein
MIMFMTLEALEKFRNSSGWEVGANAQVTWSSPSARFDRHRPLSGPSMAALYRPVMTRS